MDEETQNEKYIEEIIIQHVKNRTNKENLTATFIETLRVDESNLEYVDIWEVYENDNILVARAKVRLTEVLNIDYFNAMQE